MTNGAVQRLLATRRPDGGWGAAADGSGRTEATALCALALHLAATDTARGGRDPRSDPVPEAAVAIPAAEVAAAAEGAARWLLARQLPDGAWPVGDDIPGASWTTSLAAVALSYFEAGREAAARGGRWLLGQEGRGPGWWVRLLFRVAPERQPVALDPTLTGWPWVEGTFSWVEPTGYALLALKRLRADLAPGRAEARIEEAERMLLDRVCPDGGWNYGNTEVFGEPLWSYPDTTSLALLALGDRPDLPAVGPALSRLEAMLREHDSLLALGLGALALETHARDAAGIRTRLSRRLDEGAAAGTRELAWSALALLDGPPIVAGGAA